MNDRKTVTGGWCQRVLLFMKTHTGLAVRGDVLFRAGRNAGYDGAAGGA